jgi:hypothetical protein
MPTPLSPSTLAAIDRMDNARIRVEAARTERTTAWEEARQEALAGRSPDTPRLAAANAEDAAARQEIDGAWTGVQTARDAEVQAALRRRFGPNGPTTWDEFKDYAGLAGWFGWGMTKAMPGALWDNAVGTVKGYLALANAAAHPVDVWRSASAAVSRQPDAASIAADRAASHDELVNAISEQIAAIEDPQQAGQSQGTRFANEVAAPLVLGAAQGEVLGLAGDALGPAEAVRAPPLDAPVCATCDLPASDAAAQATADWLDRPPPPPGRPIEILDAGDTVPTTTDWATYQANHAGPAAHVPPPATDAEVDALIDELRRQQGLPPEPSGAAAPGDAMPSGAPSAPKPRFDDGLPPGSQIVRRSDVPGKEWIQYQTADGRQMLRFRADQAVMQRAPRPGRNYTTDAIAAVDSSGRPDIVDGRHRVVGAANGDVIPPDLGGVEGQPGVLDYEFDSGVEQRDGVSARTLQIDYRDPDVGAADADRLRQQRWGR